MPRSIVDFRSRLTGSGARPNLFRVIGRFPILAAAGEADDLISFHVEAASLPEDKIGEIELAYMGRKLYYPGDRDFEPWTITVINDEPFKIRDTFERWMSALNSHVGNIRDPLAARPDGYTADWTVQQLSKIDGPAIKQYKFSGVFPTQIGAIDLAWETMNTIEKFQVTLRYQWWDAVGINGPTSDGDAGALAG
jgi:hypothetical protein